MFVTAEYRTKNHHFQQCQPERTVHGSESNETILGALGEKAMWWGSEEETKAPLVGFPAGTGKKECLEIAWLFVPLGLGGGSGIQSPPTPPTQRQTPGIPYWLAPSPKCLGSKIPSLFLSRIKILTLSVHMVSDTYRKNLPVLRHTTVCVSGTLNLLEVSDVLKDALWPSGNLWWNSDLYQGKFPNTAWLRCSF